MQQVVPSPENGGGVLISSIDIGRRLRATDSGFVDILRAGMLADGQLQPVLLSPSLTEKRRFDLLDGAHRIAAAERLGWKRVRAEILEIDSAARRRMVESASNLLRRTLSPIDRAMHIKAWWDDYHSVFPEAVQHGGDRRPAVLPGLEVSATTAAAEHLEFSTRQVSSYLGVARRLAPGVASAVSKFPKQLSLNELHKLSKFDHEKQKEIVDALDGGKNTVAAASGSRRSKAISEAMQRSVALKDRSSAAFRRDTAAQLKKMNEVLRAAGQFFTMPAARLLAAASGLEREQKIPLLYALLADCGPEGRRMLEVLRRGGANRYAEPGSKGPAFRALVGQIRSEAKSFIRKKKT